MSRNDALLDAFATELRSRRSRAGLSQEALALRADVNRTYVAKLELARSQPTLSVLFSLAEALGVEMPDLIRGALARYRRPLRAAKPRKPAAPRRVG
jgi:transcriptional regulator with XRE-family HTH domain